MFCWTAQIDKLRKEYHRLGIAFKQLVGNSTYQLKRNFALLARSSYSPSWTKTHKDLVIKQSPKNNKHRTGILCAFRSDWCQLHERRQGFSTFHHGKVEAVFLMKNKKPSGSNANGQPAKAYKLPCYIGWNYSSADSMIIGKRIFCLVVRK